MIDVTLDPATYQQLRSLAARIHRARGGGGTLHPTALLHEAWEKVARSERVYRDRGHFMAVAAVAMRQILTDRARAAVIFRPHVSWARSRTFAARLSRRRRRYPHPRRPRDPAVG